ncbi:MAG TPA: HNH endonuclease [Saprospiraceae bacterium]|nr:HNH endonuclease [Saprospiraceae bacterium]
MNITTQQYLSAIRNTLSESQRNVLNSLWGFPFSQATAKELALILSPENPNPIVASGQIGKIGKSIATYLSIAPEIYFNGHNDVPAYFLLIGPYDERYGWQMHPNLKEALSQFNLTSKNNTFLFVWNPKHWKWDSIEDSIEQVELNGKCSERWSCGNSKSIVPGDRIFLVKLGTEPKGLIGSGFALTAPFPDRHWNGENKGALFIDIDFEVLLNPGKDPILSLEILKASGLSMQNWTPQSSGISIKPELVEELEAVWFDFLTTQNIRHNPFVPTEIETQKTYTEGTPNQVTLTKYERNPYARKKCLEHFGFSCSACGFNFEKTYGQIGKNFIHVHHLRQISTFGKTYEVDPIKDLRPVCPNCHSIIHKRMIPFTIEEMNHLLRLNIDSDNMV